MREAGAERAPHRQLSVGDELVHAVVQAGDEPRAGLLVGLDEVRGELVTTHPPGEVGAAQRFAQERAEPLQHAVAGGVAERVVDLLEAVEIEEDQ